MDLPIAILLISAMISAITGACPDQCQCRDSKVLCQGLIITQFPSGVPTDTLGLSLSNTNISTLKRSDFTEFAEALRLFALTNAAMKEVQRSTFDDTVNLIHLYIKGTQITSFPEDLFHKLQMLHELIVSENRDLQSLPPKLFSPLKELRELDLSKNQLSSVPDTAFEGLHELRGLRLNKNLLKELPANIFDDLEKLEVLALHDNSVTQLSADMFSGVQNLKSLFLSSNRISVLPEGIFTNLPNLTRISLHDNELQQVARGTFGPMLIDQLWLYDNKLTTLEDGVFSNLTNVKLLVLSRNQIESVSVGAFSGLTELQEVSLHTNRITDIIKGTFSGLPKLANISLEHNNIGSISADVLHGVSHLHQLDLRNNSLQHLDQDFLDSLQVVDEVLLTSNPWKCDKAIIPLRDWLLQAPPKVPDTNALVCQTPPSLAGSVIRNLAMEDVIEPTVTQAPTVTDSEVTPTDMRRKPHTPAPKRSTPPPTVASTTTKPYQGEGATNEPESNSSLIKDGHLVIIAVVCTIAIVSAILGVVFWKRHKRDSRDLNRRSKSNSVI